MIISIRRRLLANLLVTITFVSTITLVLSYRDARQEVQELFDAQLAQSARVLQALILPELSILPLDETQILLKKPLQVPKSLYHFYDSLTPLGHAYERKMSFQVWDGNGELILQSATAPQFALSKRALTPENRGFTDELVGDHAWRIFSLWDDSERFLIQIGERYDVRDELVNKISRQLLTPSLVSLPFIGIMIWVGIGRGLRPVQKVAEEVTRRDPNYLVTMDIGPVPEEVRPLVEALNSLFLQLQVAFEKERRFNDDAAHELKTPLAALKTQAQVSLRASDPIERQQALQQVINSVDRANHLVEQMLTLARLDPQAKSLKKEHVDLHQLAADNVAHLVPKAMSKDIRVEILGAEKVMVYVEPVSMSILISNLVDNAIRYTPRGGEVIVSIDVVDNGDTILSVADTGPGIDEESLSRVYDRFYRVLGSSGSGCGLGLSIAKRIADLHQLRLDIQNKTHESGLIINVHFPNTNPVVN